MDYHSTKFRLTLKKKSPVVIVLAQLDSDYFKGLEGPFTFKDQTGKVIDLAELTAKGPVLVRLTCGCSGCDKELAYFQEIDAAYKKAGLTSVAIFKEPDGKVAKYAADKKINMLYGSRSSRRSSERERGLWR